MTDPPGNPTPWRILLILHAALVVVLAASLALSAAAYDAPDANIGAGLLALVLGVLGLPWSVPVHFVESDDVAGSLVVAAAVLNVLLHAWLGRRRGLTSSRIS